MIVASVIQLFFPIFRQYLLFGYLSPLSEIHKAALVVFKPLFPFHTSKEGFIRFKNLIFDHPKFMHRSIRIPLCFFVLSILWLVTASLLNFHMHRIFQQDLLPQTLLCKRFKEQLEKKDLGKTLFSSLSNNGPALFATCKIPLPHLPVSVNPYCDPTVVLNALTSVAWPEHRGPPMFFL
jgi:hypothetical protein